jgi:hypothetical protein
VNATPTATFLHPREPSVKQKTAKAQNIFFIAASPFVVTPYISSSLPKNFRKSFGTLFTYGIVMILLLPKV